MTNPPFGLFVFHCAKIMSRKTMFETPKGPLNHVQHGSPIHAKLTVKKAILML